MRACCSLEQRRDLSAHKFRNEPAKEGNQCTNYNQAASNHIGLSIEPLKFGSMFIDVGYQSINVCG